MDFSHPDDHTIHTSRTQKLTSLGSTSAYLLDTHITVVSMHLLYLQVANWGCGAESVFDAVSLAEQYASTKNRDDSDVWNLFLRKDLFEPVVNPSSDRVATNLLYHQIVGGIRSGEYVCSQVKRKT